MNFIKAEKQIKIWAKEARYEEAKLENQKKYLQNKIQKNPSIREAVKKRAWEILVFQYLYVARHSQKKVFNDSCVRFCSEQAPNEKRVNVKTEIKFRKELKQSIMDDYDCSGISIGDLTRKEVYEEAQIFYARGKGYIQQGDIFMTVYKKMSGEKTVRECISPVAFINIVNKIKAISKIA